MNTTNTKFLVGTMSTMTDRAGNKVEYFDTVREYSSAKVFRSKSAATAAVNRLNKGGTQVYFAVAEDAFYTDRKLNPLVKTYNMLGNTKNFFDITAERFGGCCDPATETYHSM